MSDAPSSELPSALRERTLARFENHRRAWHSNPALRSSYADWYGKIRAKLPVHELGPWIELGSGPGFAREFIPELVLTDLVQAPWHHHRISADALPYEAGEVGALVLFDVLHHLAEPAVFFSEASRVLRPGGRIVIVEPYMSPISHIVYRFFHEEPANMSVDPWTGLAKDPSGAKDPFTSNQAMPTLIFCRDGVRRFSQRFPNLAIASIERFAGFAYPATGGFSGRALLPFSLWKALSAFEKKLPTFLFRLFGFRMLVVIERR
jgi:SAM-dependent methyltransferase